MLLSGVLCDHGFAGGWPSVFYVFGMVCSVWSAEMWPFEIIQDGGLPPSWI